ncbi:hypothetical protein JF781_20570 [Mycobacterium sp. WUMAC-067]|uniref:hypothetical protein n=1 Tax=unclassified Mycobacterium TaxID=2642494 RepID=UPI001CDA12FF|nr:MULTISPECIES: hypothetical protein [unclassified Mycobacterium]MCA2244758.1 hypothetical protein [Mycobacterium sp. WUMAC-067]MCA2316338.1 hypothetical protein [Mycobacterium sp. WUMAC-025]
MGSDGLQVALDQLAATAGQWQGLGAQLTATTPPSPGQPFQPTTAAVSSINAMVSADAAAFATRTQETAGQVTNAAAHYGSQEATNATDMSNVPKVTVV